MPSVRFISSFIVLCFVLFPLTTVWLLQNHSQPINVVILFYEAFSNHSQLKLQVFHLSFCAEQRDSEWRLHLWAIHLTGEVDLQLIVVNWRGGECTEHFKHAWSCSNLDFSWWKKTELIRLFLWNPPESWNLEFTLKSLLWMFQKCVFRN